MPMLEIKNLHATVEGRQILNGLNLTVNKGQVAAIMGPNGSGKSTLIKILTGEVPPDAPTPEALAAEAADPAPSGTPAPGRIRRADKLKVVVFSQHRTELDLSKSLGDTLSPHADSVIYRGRSIHVVTWANRFLFTREQLKAPVRALSGGEQARIHIARLMLEPADILILDEPTNDLDIPSLEVLEESLEDFPGAIVLVTHDRAMLASLATRILALDGKGGARYFADYDQWETVTQREEAAAPVRGGERAVVRAEASPAAAVPARKKLTYNEQRELAQMEANIEKAEAEVKRAEAAMGDPAVIADHRRMDEVCRVMGEAQARIAALYERWAELESRN